MKILTRPKITLFLNGMTLYNISITLMFAGVIPTYIATIIQFIICLFLIKYINIIKTISKLSSIPKFSLILLAIWIIFIIFNVDFSIENIIRLCSRNQALLSYMMLFMVPYFANSCNFEYILSYLYKINKLYLSFLLALLPLAFYHFFSGRIVQGQTIFEAIHIYIGGGLLFLILFSYHFKNSKVIHCTAFLNIVLAAIFGRRSILILYVMSYVFWLIIKLTMFKLTKKIFILTLFSLIFLSLLWFILTYGEQLFPYLFERILNDTRSFTEEEMLNDMSNGNDMIFGRGILGGYRSIIETGDFEQLRTGIETGYLDMILHGGILFVILYSFFVLPGILKGLFSRNKQIKHLAIYCVLFVLYFQMASSNMSFSIRYFLFVYSLFICYKTKNKIYFRYAL